MCRHHRKPHKATAFVIVAVLFGYLCHVDARAQRAPGPPPPRIMTEDLPMQAVLYELNKLVGNRRLRGEDLREWTDQRGLQVRNRRVKVTIINQQGPETLNAAIIRRFDGVVRATWRHRLSAWIPPNKLIPLARALPSGFYMQKASLPTQEDQGPGLTGSDSYIRGGADGSGIKIAVIDSDGFTGLNPASDRGRAPATYVESDLTDTGLRVSNKAHGTGVLENVYDHAPGAEYFLYKIGGLTDLNLAIGFAVKSGVNIIAASMSYYNLGWGDDTGDACFAAEIAAKEGVLYFNGAGNFSQRHWQGDFKDSDGNGWHEWLDAIELLAIDISDGDQMVSHLSWNKSGGPHDYDFYLYGSDKKTVLRTSANSGNNYEEFKYRYRGGAHSTVYLAVHRYEGGVSEMEVFTDTGDWDPRYIVRANSTTSPSNCTHPNIISVGAVDQSNFSNPPGTRGIIESYSGWGPTNSGNQAPDLVAPTCTSVDSRSGTFCGSSGAGPNAAGVAAALWSSAPSLSGEGVRHLLFRQAEILKDWGLKGKDDIYGRGGVQLTPFKANTTWVYRGADNTSGSDELPYYYLKDAQDAATSGGRVLLLADDYPEAPIVLSKAGVVYDTLGGSAVIGKK